MQLIQRLNCFWIRWFCFPGGTEMEGGTVWSFKAKTQCRNVGVGRRNGSGGFADVTGRRKHGLHCCWVGHASNVSILCTFYAEAFQRIANRQAVMTSTLFGNTEFVNGWTIFPVDPFDCWTQKTCGSLWSFFIHYNNDWSVYIAYMLLEWVAKWGWRHEGC